MKSHLILCLLFCALTLALTGCGSKPENADAAPGVTPGAKLPPGPPPVAGEKMQQIVPSGTVESNGSYSGGAVGSKSK